MQAQGSFGRLVALTLSSVALACSVEVGPDHGATETGSTRAVVAVTRSAPAATPEEARADAFAGFLRTPADADVRASLGLAGLGLDLPAVGECRKGRTESGSPAPLPTRLELLDAGEVTLAAGGSVTTLAPRAFPTITDSIAGVVYTTRDRAAAPLPAGTSYTVATTGGSSLGPLSGEAQAPALLTEVSLGGEPFAGTDTLAARHELGVSWSPGSAGDRVYLELEDAEGSRTCTFADEAGHGVIPASAVPAPGTAAVTVHRLREAAFSDPGLTRGAVRFDFELSASVTFE
jgi:hypothetical protein